jgi:hypothetical protein
MTDATNKVDCLDRARMHEQLAATTDDRPARIMHQAMAAEYRRRAGELGAETMPPPAQRPTLEMTATVG